MKKTNLPHDATPEVHALRRAAENGDELVERYGVNNVQSKTKEEYLFPMLGLGLPGDWQRMDPNAENPSGPM